MSKKKMGRQNPKTICVSTIQQTRTPYETHTLTMRKEEEKKEK